jgi:DNA-binding Lrp family transcriptional regulator
MEPKRRLHDYRVRDVYDQAGPREAVCVSGPFDLVAVVRVREHEDLADLVTQHIAELDGVVRTETLIAFRAYSKRDPGLTWDVGG